MKKFFAITAITLAASPVIVDPVFASARGTYCQSTGIADGGYILQVAPNGKRAILSEQSIMGPRKLADMDCVPGKIQHFPDALNNYLNCRDARAAEGGLVARLFSGGIAGLHYASIREVTVLRGHAVEDELDFGRLNCGR